MYQTPSPTQIRRGGFMLEIFAVNKDSQPNPPNLTRGAEMVVIIYG